MLKKENTHLYGLIALGLALATMILVVVFEDSETPKYWAETLPNWLAVAVSVWAVCLLGATLKATRAAVRSSNEAVAVTREIGQAQVRAYVWTSGARFKFHVQNGIDECAILIMWNNSGATPAIVIKTVCSVGLIPSDLKDDKSHHKLIADMFTARKGEDRAIQSQSYIEVAPSNQLTPDQIALWRRRNHVALITAQIDFEDVFKKKFSISSSMTCIYMSDERVDVIPYRHRQDPKYKFTDLTNR